MTVLGGSPCCRQDLAQQAAQGRCGLREKEKKERVAGVTVLVNISKLNVHENPWWDLIDVQLAAEERAYRSAPVAGSRDLKRGKCVRRKCGEPGPHSKSMPCAGEVPLSEPATTPMRRDSPESASPTLVCFICQVMKMVVPEPLKFAEDLKTKQALEESLVKVIGGDREASRRALRNCRARPVKTLL